MNTAFAMRAPCRGCSSVAGTIETRNGQDCVICECGRFQYNAPKTETGREQRSITTVHNGIKPRQRARILERDGGKCFLCGSRNNLHAGHLLSVKEGTKQGLSEEQINDDENLAAMCDECNIGLGERPVSVKLLLSVLIARLNLQRGINAPGK